MNDNSKNKNKVNTSNKKYSIKDKFEIEILEIKNKFNKDSSIYKEIEKDIFNINIEEKLFLLNKAINFSKSNCECDFMDDVEIYNSFLYELKSENLINKYLSKNLEKYIPEIFYNEVMFMIKKRYNNNILSYVEDIQIYFKNIDYFKLRILKDCSSINIISNDYACIYKNVEAKNIKNVLSRQRKKLIVDCQAMLKLVGLKKREYTSLTLENEYKFQLKNNARFMLDKFIFNNKNEKLRLKEVVKTAEHKTAEILNTFKTVELLAEEQNLSPVFITMTLPPEKHPNPIKGKNTYDGSGISEGAKILTEGFNNIRANLTKQKINIMGVRNLEVHIDSCFHCHALIFINKDNFEDLKKYIKLQFKNYKADDKDFIVINTKGNDKFKARKASSYIFKYITKSTSYNNLNIDLNSYDCLEDNKKDEVIFKVLNNLKDDELNSFKNSAVRSFAGVRSLQFFGLKNCLSTFRYLCRNKEKLKDKLPQDLKNIIEESDLFKFVKFGFYSICKNIYIDTKREKDTRSRGYKKFVGVIVNNVLYLKKLFIITNNNVSKEINLHVYKVLVKYNYSRVVQKLQEIQENERITIKIFDLNDLKLKSPYQLF